MNGAVMGSIKVNKEVLVWILGELGIGEVKISYYYV